MAKLAEWIRHNQGMFVALLVLVVVMVWTYGCESKVTSLVDPQKMVNVAEFNLELAAESARLEGELELLLRQAGLKEQEFARRDAIKQKLIDFAAITVDAGTVNPAGVVGLVTSIIGIGALIDNRIKDKVIANRPLPAPVLGSTG